MKLSKVSISVLLVSVCVFAFCTNVVQADKISLLQAAVSDRAVKAMTESVARSCYNPTQTRHAITTDACMTGYTEEVLLGRWWFGTCDAGYVTIKEYQTADNQQRVYRDASQGTPPGFVLESTFGCLLPADDQTNHTLPVFELYKASITDYVYATNPFDRVNFIADGYVETRIIGRLRALNEPKRLKQCYQSTNHIHNWVFDDEACPSGYVQELILDGSILNRCDGTTDADWIQLYKYYSTTGSHRYLGTTNTAPSGYNITPVGCIWKTTSTKTNRIPIYSYSYLVGSDKDTRYASTSTTPGSPWVNDNAIIGYTIGQKVVHNRVCREASGRFIYIPDHVPCFGAMTFSHIAGLVWTYPCLGPNQFQLKVVINGNVRRLALQDDLYTGGNTPPSASYINEYILGCVKDLRLKTTPDTYSNYNVLIERTGPSGQYVTYSDLDASYAPLSGYTAAPNTIGIVPSRYRAGFHSCYDAQMTKHYFTTEEFCPPGTTYDSTIGFASHPPCIEGETALNAYISSYTSYDRRLALSAPQYFSFEYQALCVDSSWSGTPLYELKKLSISDWKYAKQETYNRIAGLDGYTYYSQVSIYPLDRYWAAIKSCWNPTTSIRSYTTTTCTSGYTSDEGFRFVLFTDLPSEPNTSVLYRFYSSAQSDYRYSTSSTPPSGYVQQSWIGYVKTVQEVGSYPLYQFSKCSLSTGCDTFLRINTTFVPPGYSQIGGILGYVFDVAPSAANPIYEEAAYSQIRLCSSAYTAVYKVNEACPAGYTGVIIFKTLPCGAYNAVLGNNVQEYCQFQKPSHPPSDTLLTPCSNPPPVQLGYTALGSVGCLAGSSSPGLVTIYEAVETPPPGSPPGDIIRWYTTDSNPRPETQKTAWAYGLSA